MKLENIRNLLSKEQVKADEQLVTEIQLNLKSLGLYPGGKLIDGDYGPMTEGAIKQFCQAMDLPLLRFDKKFALKLLITKQLPFILQTADNQESIFNKLLTTARKTRLSGDDVAAFLHRDIKNSIYITQIKEYSSCLAAKYETQSINSNYNNYPQRGTIPNIENQSLNFLNSEITEACVCLGQFEQEKIKTRWLGKNALAKNQFWSATKIIPILNVVSESNSESANIDIESCYLNNQYKFIDIVLDIVSYRNKIASSNSAAAMLKRFQTPFELENWLKNITGNQQLEFRSGYGETPFISQPSLFDKLTGEQILNAAPKDLEIDKNYLSAYDLTRLMSMLGWHLHINQSARLPGAQWHSLKDIIYAMGHDKARYAEVALETLGLEKTIQAPVILSKLGYGYSNSRNTFEITYTAFVQFIDERFKSGTQLGKLRTLAMTLRGVTNPGNNQWTELDARMAAGVTEIIRRIVTEEM